MPTLVKMPKWGLTMTEGTVTDWLLAEGAEISAGDPLFTVETEKAVNDVEAPIDGVLLRIVADKGAAVPVSGPIAIIAAPGESLSEAEIAAFLEAMAPKKKESAAAASSSASGGRESRAASRDDSGRVNASPAARKLAQEQGLELASLDATGPGGRITIDDVQRAMAERDADPTPREETITLADGRLLASLVAGPGGGPKLLFIHGLGGAQSTWQVALGELVDRHRVAAVDLPGHGASDKTTGADYSVVGLASAVAEAITALKLAPAVIVGHSLGGAVAMQLALARPELVAGLVLVDSAGLGDEINPALLDLMEGAPGTATARGLLELFYEDRRLVLDRGVDDMAQGQLADGAWAAQRAVAASAFSRARQQLDVRTRLVEVSTPTLLIWGERDRVIPLSHAIAALTALPDAQLKVMAGLGHVPQVEDAPKFARAVARFAASLGS